MIVFYQTGDVGLLPIALRCAFRFNRRLAVISTTRWSLDTPYVWVPLNSVNEDFHLVDAAYRHNSANDHAFELECIRRWFAARRAVDLLKIDRAFCADSDVLICCNPFDQPHLRGSPRLALSSETPESMVTAGMSLQTPESLARFCEFVLSDYFTHPAIIDGGKNDMDAWNYIARGGHGFATVPWTQLNRVVEGVVFDHHLMATHGFKVDRRHGCKLLEFRDGIPHAFTSDGTKVRMAGMHCWGAMKPKMASLASLVLNRAGPA